MKSKYLIEIAGILALIAIVAFGYHYAPALLVQSDVNLPLSACDPGKSACTVDLPGGGQVALTLSPQPVPLVKPFQIEVRLHGLNARRIDVDFAAIGMDMGYNRPRLQMAEAGRFVATTSLPVCVTGPMEWQVTLMIETLGARTAIPFRFSTRS